MARIEFMEKVVLSPIATALGVDVEKPAETTAARQRKRRAGKKPGSTAKPSGSGWNRIFGAQARSAGIKVKEVGAGYA